MSRNMRMSRRTMLRGVGAAVSLPTLNAMEGFARESYGRKTTSPGRVAYLYIPNGVAEGAWQPQSSDADGKIKSLNPWMQPLAAYQKDLTIFRNIWTPRGNGHQAGTATWLTGGGFDAEKLDVGGASVDQIAAKHLSGQTLLPSLELSVRGEGHFTTNLARNSISWSDARTPIPRDIEPRVVFDRMFRESKSGLGDPAVVDLVLEHSKSLKRRVGQDDEARIDEYLESLHELERRIQFSETQSQRAAQSPDLQNAIRRPEAGIPSDHGTYIRNLIYVMVLAFWSDATRVCTFMMDHGQSNRYFNFIDEVQGTWHALSHWKDISGRTEDDDGITSWNSREEKRRMYNLVTQWHTEQVAYFIKRLSEIREPEGRLLDHSMIIYGSSLADGHEHQERNLPMLLAGGTKLGIQQGRYRGSSRDSSMSALHLSVLQRLGVAKESFSETREAFTLS